MAWVIEQGNGLPDKGEIISDGTWVYKLIEYKSQIDTRDKRGNRKKARLKVIGDLFDISKEKYELLRPVIVEEE